MTESSRIEVTFTRRPRHWEAQVYLEGGLVFFLLSNCTCCAFQKTTPDYQQSRPGNVLWVVFHITAQALRAIAIHHMCRQVTLGPDVPVHPQRKAWRYLVFLVPRELVTSYSQVTAYYPEPLPVVSLRWLLNSLKFIFKARAKHLHAAAKRSHPWS